MTQAPAVPEPVAEPGPDHPWLVLGTTILASSLSFIDGSVVNVGLPAIGHSLGAAAMGLPWVVNAYLLPLSALLLLGGAAGDIYGRRRLLMLGVCLFAAASLLCAGAHGLAALLAGRLLQGVGAAMLMPNSLAILGQSFSGAAKGRAIGIWAASGAAMAAIGPILGGWLIDLGSWRAIFLLNLPVSLAAVALAWRFVPAQRRSAGEQLDLAGGVSATAALGLLTWGLTEGSGRHGWTPHVLLAIAGGTVLLVLFVAIEHRRGDRAMMPLALFGSAPFAGLSLLTLLLYGALGGLLVLLPTVLIELRHATATQAGAALLPLPLVLAATAPLMGWLAGRYGSRLSLAIGPVVVAAGLLLLRRLGPDGSYATTVLPALVVIALGMAGAVAPLTTAVLNAVDTRHAGSASGFNSAVARTGGLIATALLAATLTAHGPGLAEGFRTAAVVGAGMAALAGFCAFALLR